MPTPARSDRRARLLAMVRYMKAQREVVRRGFLSNLLFANVAGIFRYSEHVKEILDKLPTAKQGKVTKGQPIEIPQPPPVTDPDGNVQVDVETIINPKVAELGKPVYSIEDIPTPEPDAPASTAATAISGLSRGATPANQVVRPFGELPVSVPVLPPTSSRIFLYLPRR